MIAVRLRTGKKPTKTIKELRGSITGQIQTAPEPLITIDSILKAQGKVATSDAGSTLKVTKVTKADDGAYRLEVQLTAPPARLGNVGLGAPGVVIVNHRPIGELEEAVDAPPTNLILLDGNGKPWKIKEMAAKEVGNIGRYTREYDLLFEPQDGAGEPTRLVYKGWRLAIVEVPFIMKDVPIP
jgi:hypothetical protein